MTRRSRGILLSSILLAASVIATVVLWIVEGGDAMASTSTIVISIGIILVSILSVVFVYLVKVKRRSDEKKLNGRYYREFELIKDSIMNSPLPQSNKKGITEDVLEILLTAQSNGKTVEAAIGDTESFAKDIISACMSKSRSIVIGFLDGAIAFILFVLLISTLSWFEDFSTGFFNQRIDISMVLFVVVISFVLIPIIKQLSSKKSAWAYFIPFAAGLIFIGIIELFRAFLLSSSIVKELLDGSIIMIPNIAALAAFLVVLMILFVVSGSLRRLPKLK
jgi:DNA-binding ferritin-like protein (Dps family)